MSAATTTTNPSFQDPQKRFTRSRVLGILSAYLAAVWLGWFIVEVIIHSVERQFADFSMVQPLSTITLQLFMYAMLLSAASLGTAWLADFKRTQAARTAAFFVTTFSVFAWLWELWFIIPAFRGSSHPTNTWCNGFVNAAGDIITPDTRFCRLARATGAFAVGAEFGLFLLHAWSLARFVITRESDIPYPTPGLSTSTYAANPVVNTNAPNTVGTGATTVAGTATPVYPADVKTLYLTEPDDIEQLRIVAAKPTVYDSYRRRMKGLSSASLTLACLSLAGFIIITCAYIKIARETGITGATNFVLGGEFGDPVLNTSWWPLVLTLGLSLGMSSYAAFRWNRGIQGAAFLITLISALQWSSFFIYAARRLGDRADTSLFAVIGSTDAQRAAVAGIGLILICEVARAIVLFLRYRTYMPITQLDHQSLRTPGYVDAPTVIVADRDRDEYKSAHDEHHTDRQVVGAGQPVNVPGPAAHTNFAHGTEYQNRHGKGDWKPAYNLSALSGSTMIYRVLFGLTLLTLFTWYIIQWIGQSNEGAFTPANTPAGTTPEVTYIIMQHMFILTSLLALGSLASSAYAEYHASVGSAISSLYMNTLMICGYFLLVWPWAFQSLPRDGVLDDSACEGTTNTWCRISRAASILSLISLGCMCLIWIHAVGRLIARRRLLNKFDLAIHNLPTFVAALPIIGMIIWAASTIAVTSEDNTFISNYGNLQPYQVIVGTPTSYWSSIIFLLLTGVTFAVYLGTFSTYQMLLWEGWGWRHLAHHLNLVVASFMVPVLILTARLINEGSLSSRFTALASGVIITTCGQFLFYAAVLFLTHTSIYAARAPAQALRPGYQANVGPTAKDAGYNTHATKDLEKGYGGYSDPKDAYNRDIQHERDPIDRTATTHNPAVITTTAAPPAPVMTTQV